MANVARHNAGPPTRFVEDDDRFTVGSSVARRPHTAASTNVPSIAGSLAARVQKQHQLNATSRARPPTAAESLASNRSEADELMSQFRDRLSIGQSEALPPPPAAAPAPPSPQLLPPIVDYGELVKLMPEQLIQSFRDEYREMKAAEKRAEQQQQQQNGPLAELTNGPPSAEGGGRRGAQPKAVVPSGCILTAYESAEPRKGRRRVDARASSSSIGAILQGKEQ